MSWHPSFCCFDKYFKHYFITMRVIIEKNYDELSRWAARHVVETIKAFQPTAEKPFVLGLPTGSSPMGMYAEIVKAVKAGEISFKHVLTFNMDEYVGLPESHPESYHSFIGVGTVMAAREVMILCNGHSKARALQAAIEGPVTQAWTISALQTHKHGIIVCDESATDELKVSTYKYFKDIEKDNL